MLLVGWLLTADAASVYNVALLVTSVVAVPLVGFNQLLAPVASRLHPLGNARR